MDTIPVGKSISGAYGFLFGRFVTILGLSWLPAVIYAVGRLAFFRHVVPGILSAAQQGTHPSPVVHGMLLAFILFSLLMVAIIALPLNREALGLHGEPVLARLVVGARELRLFAAYVRLDIILIALVIALAFGIMGAAMGAKAAVAAWPQLGGWPVSPIVHVAVALIAIFVVLYVAFRLSFLIAPVAAAEDKARLMRAWELSAGNFWRIFVIFLAIIVPVFIVIGICEFALMGSQLRGLHDAMTANGHPDPSAVISVAAAHAPALVALAAAAIVIVNALFAGAAATAYRALVPAPEPETPAAEEHAETNARIEPFAEPASEPAHEAPAQEHVAEAVEEVAAHESEPEHPAEPSHEAPAEHAAEPVEPHDAAAPEEAHEPPPEDSAHPDAHPH